MTTVVVFAGEGVRGEDAAEADDVEGVQGGDRGPARRVRRHAHQTKDDGGRRYKAQTSTGKGQFQNSHGQIWKTPQPGQNLAVNVWDKVDPRS